jgi:DNA-binding MarR family transcriptional regulator
MGLAGAGGRLLVSWCQGGDKLDQDIFDAMSEFVSSLLQCGERLAERFDVPVSCMKAIRRVGRAVSMKELGQQLHCDPSFVTMIADALEQRGLARREPGTVDRRIKNLVLTPRGLEVKATLEAESRGVMPWAQALSVDEREQLLGLIRKMNGVLTVPPRTTTVTTANVPGQGSAPVAGTEVADTELADTDVADTDVADTDVADTEAADPEEVASSASTAMPAVS